MKFLKAIRQTTQKTIYINLSFICDIQEIDKSWDIYVVVFDELKNIRIDDPFEIIDF